ANLANDYYDYRSRNDLLNKNLTPFSGGSRFLPDGLLSPQVIIIEALIALSLGALLGLWIVYLTKSVFLLTLGIIGTCGAFIYTAPPLKLGFFPSTPPIIYKHKSLTTNHLCPPSSSASSSSRSS
ncbi:MAG: hypothetical protein ACYSUK_12830, partial [Planctomycetota bacterium]